MSLIAISTQKLKTHQKKIFLSLIGVLVTLGICLFLFGLEKAPPLKTEISEAAPVYDVTKALEDKSFWVFKSEQRLAEQEKKQEKMMAEIDEIVNTLKKGEEAENTTLEALQERLQALEQKLSIKTTNSAEEVEDIASYSTPTQPFFTETEASSNVKKFTKDSARGSIFSETVALSPSEDELKRPHYEHYIPAGSYVKAVLLTGVDVSVGISSQANPQPVLLRLVHLGSLPNKFLGKMRDCRIIAAASGELSSERAQFRLEKLSCIEPDGRVIETDVDGYISGEDGKSGMRGRMVMRDAEVLKRGFLGGLLSGLGKATSQSFNTTSISPLGAVSSVKGGDVFKQAGAEGAGNAFELMARYNIQRAEQYQPVIQISAGREVTVVFHSGREFGERRTKPASSPSKADNFFGVNP